MVPRELAGLILASAVITLDGTAATIALPAIGHDLAAPVSSLQWISNAPLLMLAALLLPAGAAADRFGRVRVVRAGSAGFAAASLASAAAPSDTWLIAARLMQGACGALVLPGVLSVLRNAYSDPAERTRMFGAWAACTGIASAAGPLLGGALTDLIAWRAVFVMSAVAAVVAAALLPWRGAPERRAHPAATVPLVPAAALAMLVGGGAYLLMEGPGAEWRGWRLLLAAGLVAAAIAALVRSPRRDVLLPGELFAARNCLPANAATFFLYFGLFGLSFLLVLYTQQVLDYSGVWAAVTLLPVSIMLLLAQPFGDVAARAGTRLLITTGPLIAAAGLFWMATGPHPLPFWTRMLLGTGLFGLGLSLAVSALTHAAVSAVPETCSGAASGLNHATVRVAGVIAIALLGSLAAPGEAISVEGFQRAMMLCGTIVAIGGVAAGVLVRDEEPGGLEAPA